MDDYTLIGGITIQQIIGCIPMFDAMTKEFWIHANEYCPKDILQNKQYNQLIIDALRTNIWFRNFDEMVGCVNNGSFISYTITDDELQSLSIADCSGKQLFARQS